MWKMAKVVFSSGGSFENNSRQYDYVTKLEIEEGELIIVPTGYTFQIAKFAGYSGKKLNDSRVILGKFNSATELSESLKDEYDTFRMKKQELDKRMKEIEEHKVYEKYAGIDPEFDRLYKELYKHS